ncbi:lipid IV(A) 3-deoxy-D-manno-octulosonic acid transferase [Undibacterium fentianense]|uniref:3-deoxy-D-manno-octulosonic acid transferase n=1 Tax=Undibacterium fentianense TaxID=2828728 RepID=A0A941IEV8_9BURK|nr:lipid IV(A) 3-deoxy-D-manno-octulosonic acid transferase [Undibacterium fentianense]MBR7800041.1 lipid IV(A) 3-deoxy-D-manno-octulosonic acid transferase [Undibacterium fentianense]
MRLFYSLVWTLALPIILLRLWLRGKQEPGYRQHVAERLGWYQDIERDPIARPFIWVHAVSAGETRAAEPIVRALLNKYPQHRILLTHMTPIGRSTGQSLFANIDTRLTQAFIPYDINWMIRRFLRHFSPCICILIETEVWPNLIAQCKAAQVPVTLVNARLSEKSLRKAQRLSSLMVPAAKSIDFVAAQSGPDAERLSSLGVRALCVTGNMKFDVSPPPLMAERGAKLRASFADRPVFICASTREGEEALILDAFTQLQLPRALLIITPRHPQRFDQVAALLTDYQLRFVRRSSLNLNEASSPIAADTQVLLGDSMGEMYMYYAASDLAFVGGSLVALGGHNLIEAFAMHKPVLTGPHTFNFSEITEQAIDAECAQRAADANQVMQLAQILLDDVTTRTKMGSKAHAFFLQHQGATERTMQAIAPFIVSL